MDLQFKVQLKAIQENNISRTFYLILKDEDGKETGPIPVTTSRDKQLIPKELTKDLTVLSEIIVQPPEDGLDDGLYLETLTVDVEGPGGDIAVSSDELAPRTSPEAFSILSRTIKLPLLFGLGRGSVRYQLNPLLPNQDQNPKRRQEERERVRDAYTLRMQDETGKLAFPTRSGKLPPGEDFSAKYKVKFILPTAGVGVIARIISFFKNLFSRKKSFDDLLDLYNKDTPTPGSDEGHFYTPPCVKFWDRDDWFGMQRLIGVDPSIIRLCTSLPDKMADARETLERDNLLGGLTVDEAVNQKRLFVCDLYFMKPFRSGINGLVVPAPIALFFFNDSGHLLPVAIRLFQEKHTLDRPNPVFYPDERFSHKYTWILAKMWYNCAEANHHETTTHLGLTHLLMEGFCLATHRHLHSSHPVFRLLKPHFVFLLAINNAADFTLLAEGGDIDEITNIGTKVGLELASGRLEDWRLDVEGTLPKALEDRGLLDKAVLPGKFFHRDDALELYEAVKTYATKYIKFYYADDDSLRTDPEIQEWAHTLAVEYKLKGIPNGGELKSLDELVQMATCVIYTCSVQHAAVNFAQYEQYGFSPNYPLYLSGNPPTDPEKAIAEEEAFQHIADVRILRRTMQVTRLLSSRGEKPLGEDLEDFIADKRVQITECINDFKEELKRIGKRIHDRNNSKEVKDNLMLFYDYLDPAKVPISISI